VVVPVTSAVLSAPYLNHVSEVEVRKSLFHSVPVIVEKYLDIPGTDAKFWRELFTSLKVLGPVRLLEVVTQTIPVLPDYNKSKHSACDWLGLLYEEMENVHTTMAHGWKCSNVVFPIILSNTMQEHIAYWLEGGVDALESAKNYIFVEGYNRRSFYAHGRAGTAAWVKALNSIEWIKNNNGSWCIPNTVTVEEASKFISNHLLSVLIKQGVCFRTTNKLY